MRVLVTGSTTWENVDIVRRELACLPSGSVIVTGDTSGVDAIALEAAAELGLNAEPMKKERADYRRYPGEGWKGLNERMLATGIELVLAFHPDFGRPNCARGTRHAVDLAEQLKIPVRIFNG